MNYIRLFHCKSDAEELVFCYQTVLTYCEKKCSSDREKLLKLEAEGREFAGKVRKLDFSGSDQPKHLQGVSTHIDRL